MWLVHGPSITKKADFWIGYLFLAVNSVLLRMFFEMLILFAVLLVLLLFLEKRYQKAYMSVECTQIDRTAIEHSVINLHMYAQVSQGVPVRLSRKVVERMVFIHRPKPSSLTKNWWFHPIYGQVGFKSLERYYLYKRCMIGYMGINHQKKLVTIAFRNSRMLVDWLHNFDIGFNQYENFAYQGPLHRGYVIIFKSFVEKIESLLDEVIERVPNVARYNLLLTGHSLGGALAILTALYLIGHKRYGAFFGRKNIKLVTFGAPYVGTKSKGHDFSCWMQHHIGYIKCFEIGTDMAPFFPKFIKMQVQKSLWQHNNSAAIIEPVPPSQPIILFSYNTSRLNLYGSHNINKYMKAIYGELKLPFKPLCGYLAY